MVEAIEDYLNNQSSFEILPENLGFTDATLTSTIQKYNELVLRRGELLRSMSELHPTIVNLDDFFSIRSFR